jgi:hypothetical protein
MKKELEEKGMKMFSLLISIEDFEKLTIIKKQMKYSTTQQAVKLLLFSSASLQDYESITLK